MNTAEIYNGIDQEPHEEGNTLEADLESYLTNFYGRLSPDVANREQFLEEVRANTLQVIHRNNEVAQILKSPEYRAIVEREKELRGDTTIGVDICIDGRIPTIHFMGLTGNTWETGAGIVGLRESPLDGQMELESARLTEAIIERTEKDPPQMLQILTAHTSLSEHRRLAENNFEDLPDHGCGRMKMLYNQGETETRDLVAANLDIHAKSADAFTALYNRAAEANGKGKLEQVAMCAVYDTDTMGLLFEYGTDHELSMTDVTKAVVASPMEAELAKIAGETGVMRDTFTSSDHLIELEDRVLKTTEFLIHTPEFAEPFTDYINTNFPRLAAEQKQGLLYTMSRNIAFQRVTGVYDLDQQTHGDAHEAHQEHTHSHPFAHHGEGYQSVSMDGVIVGEFDPEVQVFGATVSTSAEATEHIKIQTGLMDSIRATDPPYLLFISKAMSNGGTPDSLERGRGQLRALFRDIKEDADIMAWIKEGKVVPVPVLVDSKTREIRNIAKELAI